MVTFNEFCEMSKIGNKLGFKEFCAYHMSDDVDDCLKPIGDWAYMLIGYITHSK